MGSTTADMSPHARRCRCAGWLLPLLLCVSGLPSAQALEPETRFADYLLERWSDEDGLPQITVQTLAQDRAGYLWVGTQNGIARFDGQRFVSFLRADTGLDLSMPLVSLAGPEGEVWFGTPRGLLRQQDGVFSEVAIAREPTAVRALLYWQGALLAATADGLRSPEQLERPRWLQGESLHALAVDADDTLWAGGESGVFRLRADPDGVISSQRFELPEPELRVLALALWNRQLVVGTRQGVWLLDPQQGRFRRVLEDLAEVAVPTLLVDRHGSLWASSVERVQRLRADGSVEIISDADFLVRPWLHVMFEDRDGDLWMGSQRESLLRISDTPLRVISRNQGLHDPLLWSVLDDRADGLWVGTNTGLSHWHPDRGYRRVGDDAALPDPAIYSLHRDAEGGIWLGTRAGLARLQQGAIHSDPALQALANAQITSFADDDGALWIGSLEGLWRWQNGMLHRHGAAAGAPDSRVRSLLRLADGSLLVGTEAGVRRLQGDDWQRPAWAQPLDDSFVSGFLQLSADALLVTTLDKGIGVLRGTRLEVFGTEDGLPSANAWAADIIGDWVYVSTNDGAYRLPVERLLLARSEYGLRAQILVRAVRRARGEQRMGCCNGGGHARSALKGDLLFYPTTNGLIQLDSSRVQDAPAAPGLSIEVAETAAGKIAFPRQVHVLDEARDLALLFTGVALRRPAETQFRYRLHGYQSDWVAAVNQRATFTRLPPGDYQFELQGRYPGQEWLTAPIRPRIHVPPRWYERRLVQALGFLALAVALLLGWRYSLLQAARRRQVLEQAVREGTDALARANERLRIANAALLEESRTDALTGVGNRRAAMQTLAHWPAYALLMIDLDHFKALNDRHGHATGDQVLSQASALLREALPEAAQLVRWGGEEFLVLWPELDLRSAMREAERLRASLAQAAFGMPGGPQLRASCSIGVAEFPCAVGLKDWQLTLELADRALYRAKAEGRDRVRGAALALKPGELLPQEAGLAEALDRLQGGGALVFIEVSRKESGPGGIRPDRS